ncbi:MAG: hypothetical protein KGL39_04310 [Patescibacteria group bacterium]|nr:hypothetical protein [Patescibacteria group bacterium]
MKKINLSMVASVLSALAGVVGTVLTPTLGSHLATQTAVTLQAVSGLLLAIAGWHVTSVVAQKALQNHIAQLRDSQRSA